MTSLLIAIGVAMLVGLAWSSTEASHEGVVVRAGDGELTMTDANGDAPHSHEVGIEAIVERDGEPVELADLQPGERITVTTRSNVDGMQEVILVEAHSDVF